MGSDEETVTYTPPHNNHPTPETTLLRNSGDWTPILLFVGLAVTFGACIPVGYQIGVINAPGEYMRHWCNETLIERYDAWLTKDSLDVLWSTVVSIFIIGGVIGSVGGAWIADRFGRKGALMCVGVLLTSGAVFLYLCRIVGSVEVLIIGRFLIGLAAGVATSTVPMYLLELAPLKLKGTLGVLCSMGLTGGVVVGQVASLEEVLGSVDNWHYAMSGHIILVIICYIPFAWFPESPKYLYCVKGQKDEAEKVLIRIRGENYEIKGEIEEMQNEKSLESKSRSMWSVLRDKSMLLPILLVAALQGGQQLSGINAVFYYSVSTFVAAGLTTDQAKYANLGFGLINTFVALFSPYLMANCNRRPLIQFSAFLSGVFLTIICIIIYYIQYLSWLPIASIVATSCYIIFYQLGLGPIPFFIGSELFEVSTRPSGMGIGSLSSWGANFIVGMTFPILQSMWGAFVFMPFAIVCFLVTIFMRFYLPETRGKHASDVAPLISHGLKSKIRE